MAMYGEGKTRGKVAELLIEAATNQALAALVLRDAAEPCRSWVKLHLDNIYESIRRRASGGVQPNLNLDLVRQLVIALPPLAEQHRIAAEVDRLLSVVEELVQTYIVSEKRSQRLRQAILKRAFEGQLVSQDPNDEPASMLLSRIGAERTRLPSAVGGETKGKRGRGGAMSRSGSTVRKTVEVALAEAKSALTPEQLFTATGHGPETIDEFYAELKSGVAAGQIEEVRSDSNGILLRAKRA